MADSSVSPVAAAAGPTASSAKTAKSVYILITQCLQNAFFLDAGLRLCLPEDEALRMLVGSPSDDQPDRVKLEPDPQTNRRKIPDDLLQAGPLASLFDTLAKVDEARQEPLHVIHIRDWHQPSASYDEERRLYGSHCEAHSWSAEPIEGLHKSLAPWAEKGARPNAEVQATSAQGYRVGNTIHYSVASDSVYDFKPPFYERGGAQPETSFDVDAPSPLADILDRIVGRDLDLHVYVVVIGVYTDIKIKTLLTGLRSRYPIDNLILSDVLTASPNLERHLAGLDFAQKVLNVEIIHSLNDLVAVLYDQRSRQSPPVIPDELIQDSINFREYRSYFLDKQNLLAYQDMKQIEYLDLTRRRATRIYHQIFWTNRLLIGFGFGFLLLTLLLAVVNLFWPEQVAVELVAVTGGLSLIQLVTVFFRNPIQQIQKNLNNLVQMRANLETHSLTLALMRYHFSKPERLYNMLKTEEESQQLANLEKQMTMIQQAAQVSSELFSAIGFNPSEEDETAGSPGA